MRVEFSAVPANEAFSRSTIAAFIMPMDPTIEELTEVKTAVSEAVSNSIIHGYDGSEANTVVMECQLYSSGKVVISVEDTGKGIPDIEQARQPLFTTGDNEERSGMGFTVMESFMDKVKVVSSEGKGTKVTMTKYLDVVSG
jgi:stage II sporulation protein AB (anti-sigma F factor)